MLDPSSMSPGSIMPAYPWMIEDDLDISNTVRKLEVLQKLGTPYTDGYIQNAQKHLKDQANAIANNLKGEGVKFDNVADKEIVAIIAYLQRLGTDIKKLDTATN